MRLYLSTKINRIYHHISEIKKKGLAEFVRKIRVLNIMVFETAWFVIFLPVSICIIFFIRALRPFLIIRFGYLISWRIGHYVGNTDRYLCERQNQVNTNSIKTIDLWFERTKSCNSQLNIMFKRVINIYPRWLLHPVYILNNWLPGGDKNKIAKTLLDDRDIGNLTYNSHEVNKNVANIIEFTKEEEERGRRGLLFMGLKPESKFITLIVRDAAYLKNQTKESSSGVDWSHNNYRDTNIQNYMLAADELVKHGYYVIRMGAVVNEPMNSNNNMVIDYATNGMRTEFMDVYLGAKCDFCISTATGYDAIPSIFRRPKLTVNLAHVEYFHSFFLNDLTLFMKIKNKNSGEFLSLKSIIDSGFGRLSRADSFVKSDIELIENTPAEIRDATVEMILRVSGKWNDDWYDRDVQPIIESIFSKSNINGQIQSRFTTSFLKDNMYLLKTF